VTRPILWILAGPNGAGKSKLYETWLKRLTKAEFVNADLLAAAQFGHPAQTEDESLWGQQAAEERRQQLMRQKAHLVVESTFSHPSKLELVKGARAAGYEVAVAHLSVDDVAILIARVAGRVRQGGHPVPEERIRRRFVRNQALIREVILLAHHGWVFDSSLRNAPPRLCAEFSNGTGAAKIEPLPAWVEALYGQDLV
jgi:predicted ABC-type ATPase